MKRTEFEESLAPNTDELRNCPDCGERQQWGNAVAKARRRRLGLILLVSLFGIASTAISIYAVITGNGCLFMYLFKFPCPGCGLTRANVAFLRGELAVALGYHPLFFMPQLIMALGMTCVFLKKYRRWLFFVIIACITVYISVWLVRISFFGWRG